MVSLSVAAWVVLMDDWLVDVMDGLMAALLAVAMDALLVAR